MKFALINMLRDPSQLPAPTLAQIADALERQLFEHVLPMCDESGGPVNVAVDLANVPADTIPVMVLDDAQQAGELGVHTLDQSGKAAGYAFWGPLLVNGGTLTTGVLSLSATISHEVIEIVGDPYTGYWADKGDGSMTALELCDAVEDQSYPIDGIMLSDFLSPRWFRQGIGPYHFGATKPTGLVSLSGAPVVLSAPFSKTPGGYTIDETITVMNVGTSMTSANRVRNVKFGPKVPEWKRALKLAKSRTRLRVAA